MSATIPVKRSELEALQRMLNDALERLVRKEPDTLGALVSVQGSVLGICSFFPPENSLGDGTGTVSTKADSGIDPEISSLRERVRGLEEALRRGCYIMSEPHASGWRLVVGFNTLGDVQDAHDAVAAALLPLPEGGFGLSVSVAESGISPAAPARTETPGQAGKGAA